MPPPVDITLLWVVMIVIIGVAISIYSLCKGCSGLNQQQRTVTARMLIAPYAAMVQQLRAQEAVRSRLFMISGTTVRDKDPPSYDELFAPPPSYEETIKYLLEEEKKKRNQSTSQQNVMTSPQQAVSPEVVCDQVTVTVTAEEQLKKTLNSSKKDENKISKESSLDSVVVLSSGDREKAQVKESSCSEV